MAAEPSLLACTLANRRVEGKEFFFMSVQLLVVRSGHLEDVPDSGFLGSEARASFRLAPLNDNRHSFSK